MSTDGAHCAKVGTNLLSKGGSAVDSAIGTLLCMGIVIPNSMGIGGGCLMTIYETKTGKAISINGRETAPSYATEDMFEGHGDAAARGPLSIGVPGELAAYWEAHKRYGKLPWRDLFEETIMMAQYGTPVVSHLASALRDPRHANFMSDQMRELFTNKTTKQVVNTGDILKMVRLAETLRKIRDNGVREFYEGKTGQSFIEDLKRQGGKITMDDLRDYRVEIGDAMEFKLTPQLKLFTQPVPGSGIILSMILRIMRNLGYYKSKDLVNSFEKSSLYYHHLIESFKFAYAQRAELEDKPDDQDRHNSLMDKLNSENFILSISEKIDNKTHEQEFYYKGLGEFRRDAGTAHVSVLDSDGLAVATTTSVNLYFGSGLMSNSTGIIYNDIMDDFVSPDVINKFGVRPSPYNHIKAGRRPISSMAPSVFVDENGRVRLIIGASGGTQITTGIASVSLRHLFLDDDIKTAIDGRRLHHQFLPNEIIYEQGFRKDILNSLREARNHTCKLLTSRSSIVMAVANQPDAFGNNQITANSDARKGGAVDGL